MSDKKVSGKKRKGRSEQKPAGKDPAGLPNEASIVEIKPVTSPKGESYRILRTIEMDVYDAPTELGPQKDAKA